MLSRVSFSPLAWVASLAMGAFGCSSSADDEPNNATGTGAAGVGGGAGSGGTGNSGASGGGGQGGQGADGGEGGKPAAAAYRCGDPRRPMSVPSFGGPAQIEAAKGTGGTAAGDLDGDGRDEFVAQIQFKIYDLEDGAWTSHAIVDSLSGRGDRFAGDIEIADINADGDLDIIVPDSDNSGTQGAISWFENPGSLSGDWTEHVVTTFDGNGTGNAVEHLSELEVADIDQNGWPDIMVRDISHGVWVLMQVNDGDWAPRRFIPTLPREGLRVWDPDGNGRLDLALNGVWIETPEDPTAGAFVLHPIAGMEAWYAPDGSTASIRDYACKVDTADFDGDGRLDLAITNAEELSGTSDGKPHGISVYLQPANRLTDPWPEVRVFEDHYSWHTLMIADFDFDGSADLLTAISAVGTDSAADSISLWLNQGDGRAFTRVEISGDATVYQGVIGDADGDGDCDMVAPEHFNSGPIRFFENTTAP